MDIKKELALSWEKIRMVLHEQDEQGTRDNMFKLEAIAQAQSDKIFNDPRVVILDDDQSLPKHYSRMGGEWFHEGVIEVDTQQDMLKAGFKRVRRVNDE